MNERNDMQYCHFVPLYFADNRYRVVDLVSLEVPEIGFSVQEKESRIFRPYPNKRYLAAGLRSGRRNLLGFATAIAEIPERMTCISVWRVHPLEIGDEEFLASNVVEYTVERFSGGTVFSDSMYFCNNLGHAYLREKHCIPTCLYQPHEDFQCEDPIIEDGTIRAMRQRFNARPATEELYRKDAERLRHPPLPECISEKRKDVS